MAYSVDAYGLCVQNASTYFTSGYVQGGKIRYDTLEPKVFKYLRLRSGTVPTGAALALSVVDQAGNTIPVVSFAAGFQPLDDVLISNVDTVQENVSVRLDITTDGTAADLPIINGWQVKALPGSVRQVTMQLPLLCFDFEADLGGQRIGYKGRAADRLSNLEALAKSSGTVIVQNLRRGTSELVIIDDMQYVSTADATPGRDGTGGVVTLILRTVN